jgi:molecular chaperone HscC
MRGPQPLDPRMQLGIDLGTTHSLAALHRDGEIELIPNSLGHVLTPSAVSIDEHGRVLVGLPARERLSTAPEHTAVAFKRWMGSERRLQLGRRTLRPEELSALVLGALKADAEAHCGQAIDSAVITVPAYFNQAQRRATQTAAELAGLKLGRLLNEPTAAGLAYGLQERPEHSTFLVFDLGGGTFDVSVLDYFEGVVQVRASAGDTRLGGEDFTAVLQQHFLKHAEGLSRDAAERLRESGALWRAAEQAKRALGEHADCDMSVVDRECEHRLSISRIDFEQASAELVARLRRPIERALMDARLQPDELAEVVLVGGATRMPIVRQTVARLFQRLPLRHINPDETIARGAAVQAGLLARDAALDEVVLTDVMPYSLGVIIEGDRFSPIIERNTPVPVSRVERYNTVQHRQTQVVFDICQGESPIGSENLKIGSVSLEVPPLPAGEARIDVRFSYDASGLLVVDTHELTRDRHRQAVIQQLAGAIDAAEQARILKALEALKVHPREEQQNRYLIERAKRLYEDRLGDERAQVQEWLHRFQQVLDRQRPEEIQPAQEEFAALLDSVDRGFVL